MRKRDLVASYFSDLIHTIQSDYNRIIARVQNDPATGGDQVEEKWKQILEGWLPSSYRVVTKGRIINQDNEESPQVDILILHPGYPKSLLQSKYYPLTGVIAAFECKLTLRTHHLDKFLENSQAIKSLEGPKARTPYDELRGPIIYGLLAHGHAWKRGTETLRNALEKRIIDQKTHVRNMPDIICVANLSTLALQFELNIGPNREDAHRIWEDVDDLPDIPEFEEIIVAYFETEPWGERHLTRGVILASLIQHLLRHIGMDDPMVRPFAQHYAYYRIMGGQIGHLLGCDPRMFSDYVLKRLQKHGPDENTWSRWSRML